MSARLVSVFLAAGLCLSGCESTPSAQAEPTDYLAVLIQKVKTIKVEPDGTETAASPGGTSQASASSPTATKTSQQLASQDDNKGFLQYWREGTDLVFNTSRDMALSDDGLISMRPKFEIKVINGADAKPQYVTGKPLDVTPYADRSVAPTPVSATQQVPQAPQNLPSLPIGIETMVTRPEPAPVQGRLIQIGAFSSLEAAQAALTIILSGHPQLASFRPHLESVKTPEGARVRLKLGPVADQATAERLCQDLKVTDSWCARAG